MNKSKSKSKINSDDALSISSSHILSDNYYNNSISPINQYFNTLINNNNPLEQLYTKSKLKNVNNQYIKKTDTSPKASKSPTVNTIHTPIIHNYTPDYKSLWFTTENNLSLELYIKHLFNLVELNLQCNLTKNTTKAILVPHTGIKYSGLCAASAYYELLNRSPTTNKIKRVIMLCTHHNYKQETHLNSVNTYSKLNIIGSSYTSISSYKDDIKNDTQQHKTNTNTNPGLLMDIETINRLKPYIEINNDLFDNEHSFYTQLPFIETIAPHAVICPLLIGNIVISKNNQHKIDAIFTILTLLLCMPDTILICSSDLSHINGDFTHKINNYIYQNIRKNDNDVLQFIYNIINHDKNSNKSNVKSNIKSNVKSNIKSNSITRYSIASIDELLLLQNTSTCGIMAIYMFSKLLYEYKYATYLIQTRDSNSIRNSNSISNSTRRPVRSVRSGSSGSSSSSSGIYVSSGGSGGSGNSGNSDDSSNISGISGISSSSSYASSGGGRLTDIHILHPRISCYYTSIIRENINMFEFNKSQLIPIIDIPNAKQSSVSYLGMVFTTQDNINKSSTSKIAMICSDYEKIACIGLAREHLYYSLLNAQAQAHTHINTNPNQPNQRSINMRVPFTLIKPINSPVFNLQLGVYTTVYKSLSKSLSKYTKQETQALAGCIGTLETNNDEYTLEYNIKKYVVLSATDDPRFTPITFDEFDLLNINITILYDLLPISINEYFGSKFKLGRDGILIKQSTKQGYFLPSVATDFNYDKQTLLNELCINKVQSTSKQCFRLPQTKLFYNEGIDFSLDKT